MSILFSNFAVRKEKRYMKQTLNHILNSSLDRATSGLNEVLSDLKEGLGEERFKNEYYIAILKVSSMLDGEYFRREKEKEGI